jgi:hypothetical protein
MPRTPTLALAAVAVALVFSGSRAAAQEGGRAAVTTFSASLAGGAELGQDHGSAGVGELELAAGIESPELGLRGELAGALGLAPDSHVALRPGVRFQLPATPFQLRAALDAANSRGHGFGWRWLLVGFAAEMRVTSELGLYAEVDTGVPLNDVAGVPLLFRGGAAFRF